MRSNTVASDENVVYESGLAVVCGHENASSRRDAPGVLKRLGVYAFDVVDFQPGLLDGGGDLRKRTLRRTRRNGGRGLQILERTRQHKRRLPLGGDFQFTDLSKEAYEYIEKGRALVKSPIERLKIMNQPAIDFYNDKGVDIEHELLEISLCAQHNNGGLDIDCWWKTNVDSFYAVGEAAASHGVYRPGGSALNAGQCGSTRAAQYIAFVGSKEIHDHNTYLALAEQAVRDMIGLAEKTRSAQGNVLEIRTEVMNSMSECGGAIRNNESIKKQLEVISDLISNFDAQITYDEPMKLRWIYRLRDILISQKCYLSAMVNYNEESGLSRGSALYTNLKGIHPHDKLPEEFTYLTDDGSRKDLVQETMYKNGCVSFNWRNVRPIPENDDFFENVWRDYRKNKNVY